MALRVRPVAGVDDGADGLSLDTSLADAVTVIEWGAGLVEQLSDDRLEITLVADPDTESRVVTLTGVGRRWA